MSATEIVYAYTESEARKPPLEKKAMPPLFDEPTTLQNWHKHVNWIQSILLLGTPLIALYGMFTTELQTKTLMWTILYYFITGLGITAGTLFIFIKVDGNLTGNNTKEKKTIVEEFISD